MRKTVLSKILMGGNYSQGASERQPDAAKPGVSRPPFTPTNGAAESTEKAASLYEDTLSKRTASRWNSLIWAFFGLLVIGAIVAAFLGTSTEERIVQLAEVRPRSSDSSELVKMVEEVRNREAGSQQTNQDAATADSVEPTEELPGRETTTAPAGPLTVEKRPSAPPTQLGAPDSPPVRTPDLPRQDAPRPAVAPAPSSPEPVVQKEAPKPAQTSNAASSTERQTATSGSETMEPAPGEGAQASKAPSQPDPEDTAAYESLIQNSQTAARLVVGAYPTLAFQTWRIVQRTEREIWVDLIANWTNGGSEVHFIWSVSREGGKVRPLSEAARNLERET